jgi:murein L,D-transpeptidase YafK
MHPSLRLLMLLVLIATSLSCPNLHAQHPTSKRAENAITRVTPQLKSALVEKGLILGSPIFIRIFKASSEVEVWVQKGEKFTLFKTYPICYFSGKPGPKLKTGDKQSPEGFYQVSARQLNPHSSFHLSFNLGYPNAYDRAHGRTGGALMVHGNCVSIGCYAMTDKYIEEIYTLADAALRNGQHAFHIHAFPFRLTAENLAQHKDDHWLSFWKNLQQGYDYFEQKRVPPKIRVRNKAYIVQALH